MPKGHFNIEPYFNFFAFNGVYTKTWSHDSIPHFYSANLYIPASFGITPFFDAGVTLQAFYQFTQGQNSTEFGDIPFGIGFQLLTESKSNWYPSIKLCFQATAPTGNYNNLNPNKLGTDSVGYGTWFPKTSLVLGRLLKLSTNHFLSYRIAINYTVPTPVSVKNFNAYGGGFGTKGTVYPGNIFWTDLALEYNISQNWAFALDIFYQHFNKNRFSGNKGTLAPGIPAIITRPAAELFSLAPALEYNFNVNIGLIGGVWFTVAGRNSAQFLAGSLALNIYI